MLGTEGNRHSGHWLKGIVRENEYTFHIGNSEGMWHAMTSPDGNLPLHLLSFFGHYGVPVFLFLSGYGLVLKYENSSKLSQNGLSCDITS